MNAGVPTLNDLIDRLETMPERDREFVLSGLDDGECARLMPLLSDQGEPSLSADLSRLVAMCRGEGSSRVTPRAAEELVKAARQGKRGDGSQDHADPAPSAGFRERLTSLFRGPSVAVS